MVSSRNDPPSLDDPLLGLRSNWLISSGALVFSISLLVLKILDNMNEESHKSKLVAVRLI